MVFKSLTSEQLRGIVDLMVMDLRRRLYSQGMSIELTDAARDLVAKKGTDKIYGARPLRRAIQTLIEDQLAEEMLGGKWQAGDIIYVDVTEDGETLSFAKGAGQIIAPEERVHMDIAPARSQWSAPRAPAPDSISAE